MTQTEPKLSEYIAARDKARKGGPVLQKNLRDLRMPEIAINRDFGDETPDDEEDDDAPGA